MTRIFRVTAFLLVAISVTCLDQELDSLLKLRSQMEESIIRQLESAKKAVPQMAQCLDPCIGLIREHKPLEAESCVTSCKSQSQSSAIQLLQQVTKAYPPIAPCLDPCIELMREERFAEAYPCINECKSQLPAPGP